MEMIANEINLLNLSKCKIMHYTSFVGDSFKTQIELLDKLNDNTLLSFDPGMLYVQKGLKELKPILDKTDILLINENELRNIFLSKDFCRMISLKKNRINRGTKSSRNNNLKFLKKSRGQY